MLLIYAFLSLASPTPSHAIHAYHNDSCGLANEEGSSFHLRTRHDWAAVRAPEGDEELEGSIVEALPATPNADEFYLAKGERRNVKTEVYNDGCWVGTEGSYDTEITVLKTTPATEKLGLRVGQRLAVSCSTEDIDPVGPSCNR